MSRKFEFSGRNRCRKVYAMKLKFLMALTARIYFAIAAPGHSTEDQVSVCRVSVNVLNASKTGCSMTYLVRVELDTVIFFAENSSLVCTKLAILIIL